MKVAIPNVVHGLAKRLREATSWRRFVYALGLGAAAALAFPPFLLFPLMLVAYGGLVFMIDGARARARRLRAGALIGWAFGFGYFLVGMHWIGYAFLVDADKNQWMLPFVAVLFPGGLALFTLAAGVVCVALWRSGPSRIFVFALVFFAAEYLRGHILTGLPWNLPGYGWGASLAVLQSTAWIGVYGLSLLTLVFGASFALLADKDRRVTAAMAVVFALLWAGGAARLATADNSVVPGVRLRIVQPAISQAIKYDPQYVSANWQRILALSAQPGSQPVTHIIWPEAAPPFVPLSRQARALADIKTLLGGTRLLLTGAVRVEDAPDGVRNFYNSFYLFGPDGAPLAEHDKFHLVPFGEYLPFAAVFDRLGISEIASSVGGFSAGPGPATIFVPGAPLAGPLICYEIIFPGAVIASPRPGWLVAMTDDSWFGPAAGPEQHLLIARVRAIEEGLPVARAANSGISAIIDAYGQIPSRLDQGVSGILDGMLPVALTPTIFERWGFEALLLLVLLCGAGMFTLSSGSKRSAART